MEPTGWIKSVYASCNSARWLAGAQAHAAAAFARLGGAKVDHTRSDSAGSSAAAAAAVELHRRRAAALALEAGINLVATAASQPALQSEENEHEEAEGRLGERHNQRHKHTRTKAQ